MSTTDILTLLAIILSAIAVGFAAYQAILNRKALVAARKSIEMSTRTRHIEMLPKAGFAIHVDMKLSNWISDLSKVIELSQQAMGNKDDELLKELAGKGLKSPDHLVDKFMYEKAPPWLSEIYISSAQFYYDAKAPQVALWGFSSEAGNYSYIPSFIERCEDSINHIRQFKSYLDDIVPRAYLETPASINDDKFIG